MILQVFRYFQKLLENLETSQEVSRDTSTHGTSSMIRHTNRGLEEDPGQFVKPRKKKKRQNGNFVGIIQTKIWKFYRSRITKRTSSLNSSHEIY